MRLDVDFNDNLLHLVYETFVCFIEQETITSHVKLRNDCEKFRKRLEI